MSLILDVFKDYIGNAGTRTKPTKFKFAKTNKYSKEDLKTNEVFKIDYPESHAENIANCCAFIKEFKTTGLTGNEPAWYAALEVIIHCADGEEKCHEFSSVAPDYDEKLTKSKALLFKAKKDSTVSMHNY